MTGVEISEIFDFSSDDISTKILLEGSKLGVWIRSLGIKG